MLTHTTWMSLNTVSNERSQAENDTLCVSVYMKHPEEANPLRQWTSVVVSGGRGMGSDCFNGYSVSFWGDKVLESGDLWQ